ncbi:glycosyltransferase family 4 protein [Psychroserpens sp. Hel_I_66]|uniref:glycosyltransferase family 4 protein n=1 Tax=Psychroserpens sp. Hel_I_66 TaxID=1250004 RepID=UPI0006478BC1|nr:glycosyltransferase family 4 protein [Psychroserpens sp. Hel_I_66]
MKNILYIGNNLKNSKSNISGIQILGPLLESEGYHVQYASSKTNKALRLFDMIKSCLSFFKKVDVVIIDTYSTQNFYYAFIISQLCRILDLKYFTILHGGNLPSRLQSNPKMSGMIFKNAKCNVSPSNYLKISFNNYGLHNMVYIPNTLEIKNYNLFQKTYEVPKLLWVRSFSEIYNPKLAVNVFKSLRKTYPNAQLCMVGPDSDGSLKEIKALAQQLNVDVKFTGKLSKKEWINLSKDYNVFINTTNFDNSPVSVVEAMALGLPVVSTNVGGMPYLIETGRDGILVKKDHVDEMVNAIVEILKNNIKREEIIKNARIKAETFDWAKIKLKWLDILN